MAPYKIICHRPEHQCEKATPPGEIIDMARRSSVIKLAWHALRPGRGARASSTSHGPVSRRLAGLQRLGPDVISCRLRHEARLEMWQPSALNYTYSAVSASSALKKISIMSAQYNEVQSAALRAALSSQKVIMRPQPPQYVKRHKSQHFAAPRHSST